jgi:hypothetical protein
MSKNEGVGMGFETVKVDERNVRISEKKNIVRGYGIV